MIQYRLRQNLNKFFEKAYGKWYAVPIVNETIDLDGLANHMASHNTPYSRGIIRGVLTDMVTCIKEELTNGNAVRIDDLAIFKVSIISKKGCEDKSTYKASEFIEGVRMRAMACGELSTSKLKSDITLKRSSLDKDDAGDVDIADTGELDNTTSGTDGSTEGNSSSDNDGFESPLG